MPKLILKSVKYIFMLQLRQIFKLVRHEIIQCPHNPRHKKAKGMGNVKIKRVKRNKKEVYHERKVLAGLGLASSFASTGVGLVSPNKTAIVSEVSTATNANN